MKKVLAVLTALAVVMLPASPAWAHATLVASEPANGATLAKAPASVALTFSEQLNPDFTTIVVSDAAQQRVPASAPAIEGSTGTLTLSQPVGNGTYLVAFRIVSVDGHTVQGSYPFTVSDPALPPPAAAAAPSASGAAAAPETTRPGIPAGVLIGIGAVGVLCAAVAVYLYFDNRRRRRLSAAAD